MSDHEPMDLPVAGDIDGQGSAPSARSAMVKARARSQAAALGAKTGKARGKYPKMRKGQRRLLAQENRRKALELRKGGATYEQIATAVGYKDASGAYKAVQSAIKNITTEASEEVKAIQVERLNHMLLVLWSKVQLGDERAIETSLRVMERLDRHTGNDQPGNVNININHQENAVLVVDGSKDDYIAAMARMAGIQADGTNAPGLLGTEPHDASAMGEYDSATDEIIGTVIEHHEGDVSAAVHDHVSEETPALAPEEPASASTPKKFKFGVDPTVKKETKK